VVRHAVLLRDAGVRVGSVARGGEATDDWAGA